MGRSWGSAFGQIAEGEAGQEGESWEIQSGEGF